MPTRLKQIFANMPSPLSRPPKSSLILSIKIEDASVEGEQRWAFIGYSKANKSLYVVAAEDGEDAWRIISARKITSEERLRYEEKDDPY